MSNKNIKAQMLVDLLIEQQQLIIGGKSANTSSDNTPSTVDTAFPNTTNGSSFGSNILGEGFPNVNGGSSGGSSVLGTGYPNTTNGDSFGSTVLGKGFPNVTPGNSTGNGVQTSNSNQNSSGVIVY